MNFLGSTKDNIHVNDTEIQNGSLSVDGDLFVGGNTTLNDLSVNELTVDGYKLPTTKGNAGDIIVATTDGSTSEWQPGFQGTARVVINKFTGTDSRIRTQAENGLIISIEQAGFGSKTYIEDEFPIGSVIVIRAYGNWSYLRSSEGFIPEGKFWLLFSNNPPSPPLLIELFASFPELPFAGTYPSSKGQVGNWELNIQITRVNATGVRIGGTLQNSLAETQNQVEIPIIFPEKIAGNPDIFTIPGYPIDVAVKWQDTSSQGGGVAWIYPTLCGYTQDLINAGTKIVATSQSLSGNHLLLGNLNANGPSGYADAGHDLMFLSDASKPINGNYFLPTTDGGVAGGVLTTDGAGTTSFQTLTSGVTRAWVNKYSILTNPTFGAGIGIPTNLDSTGSGSKNYTDVNFPIGSQLHIQACGSWNVNTTNLCAGQFVLAVGGGGFTITDVFELVAPVTTLNEVDTGLGYWSVDINIVRVGATNVRLGRVSVNSRLTSTSTINVPIVNSITNNANGFTFSVPTFPFDIDLQWIDQSSGGQCFPVAGTYNHNVINANDTLAVTSNPSLDHNTLSNLTTGDPHSQYTKLSGRVGGQILSGGITPLHDLKLKSHSIGLDNVIVKDLNTEFKKDIDMDNNNISNANLISNTDGSIQYNTPSYGLEITTQNNKNLNIVSALDAKLTANNILDISAGSVINLYNGLATQMTIDGSEIGANIPVNMNSNNIINAKDIIDASTNNKIDMGTGGFLNTLELSSSDEVKIVNTTSNNFISSSSAGLNVTSNVGSLDISSVNAGNTITMNDGSLLGGMSIKSNTVGVLIQENSSANNMGVTSGSVGMVCNNGQLNIRNTDAANDLTIAKQNGGNINLDVQTGGGVVKVNNSNLNMNFNGIINCAFIDGLKPSGGLYSESSGFIITSATLTETNLLGQGASSGTLAVPANGFTALDAYSFKCSGVLSGGTNDLFTLRLKSLVDGTTPVEFGAINVTLADNGLIDVPWSVTADFTIRTLGIAGVAVLVLSGNFSYSNNNDVVRIYLRTIIDSTNFDTTLSNELQFTFQNDATNPLTSFRIDQSSFTKWY